MNFWDHFGSFLGTFGTISGAFKEFLGTLMELLGAVELSWDRFDSFENPLGPFGDHWRIIEHLYSLGTFENPLGPLRTLGGPVPLRTIRAPFRSL